MVASFVDNAGSSTIQGVELEGAISFTERLTATYGIGYVDAEFDEFRSVTVVSGVPVPIDLSDTAVFQNTPEWNGNLTLRTGTSSRTAAALSGTVSGSYRERILDVRVREPAAGSDGKLYAARRKPRLGAR